MLGAVVKIGPADHGKPMRLEDFAAAETQDGYLYELGRGVIVVSDIPKRRHGKQVELIRDNLSYYRAAHPGIIDSVFGGSECKFIIAGYESARHPDLAVYRFPPRELDAGEDLWAVWVPELVFEIVSPGSETRDYVEKREEYLAFGVQEYWIVDAAKEEVLILRRVGGRWQERVVRPQDLCRSAVLAGFEISALAIFEAARQIQD